MMTSAVFLCSLAATMLSATPCQGTGSSDVGQRRRLRAVQEDRNEAMDQRRELQSVLSAEEIEALTNMFEATRIPTTPLTQSPLQRNLRATPGSIDGALLAVTAAAPAAGRCDDQTRKHACRNS